MIAGPPDFDVTVPAAVVAVAAGEPLRPVWVNQVGGMTFAVGEPPGHHFLKWNPRTSGIDLSQEISRLEWAAPVTPVPVLIDRGAAEEGEWFTSRALPGENAVAERWKADPATAVAAVGKGLRRLHDTLPAEHCPFSWSLDDRLAKIEERAALDLIDPATWHAEHQALNLGQASRTASCTQGRTAPTAASSSRPDACDCEMLAPTQISTSTAATGMQESPVVAPISCTS